MPRYIEKRSDGLYRLNLRVPADVIEAVGVSRIRDSLHTSIEAEAIRKAERAVAEYREGWNALRAQKGGDAQARFAAAKRIVRIEGFVWRTADEIVAAPDSEILRRAEATVGRHLIAPALLGQVERPALPLSGLLEEVENIRAAELARKSPMQRHRWRIARERAVRNLIGVIGDLDALDIPRDEARAFRSWWADKMMADGLKPVSPNRDMENLGGLIRTVAENRGIDPPKPFTGLRFADVPADPPPPATDDEIRALFAALQSLNGQAAAIVELMAQTGLRPSEACNLDAPQIRLDDAVPHIRIRWSGKRDLKTANAPRRIPLVGRALEAARRYPGGFERYADKEASLCATVGKWMRGVVPGRERPLSPYSLRHGFQDRLTALGPGERIDRDLMGHGLSRERYGAGASLERLVEVMDALAVR